MKMRKLLVLLLALLLMAGILAGCGKSMAMDNMAEAPEAIAPDYNYGASDKVDMESGVTDSASGTSDTGTPPPESEVDPHNPPERGD